MVVSMAAMFFVAISIPHAFSDEGNAAVVLVVAYAVVRWTHLAVTSSPPATIASSAA